MNYTAQLVRNISEDAYMHLKKAVGVAASQEDNERCREGINGAYMSLAQFCDKMLRLKDEGMTSSQLHLC
jgi:hypothetical protein